MQTYLITGANRGIGLEMTRQALEQGHRVIATCRNPSDADKLSALQGELDVHSLEVTDDAAISALATKLNDITLDVLVNNAGLMAKHQSVDDMDTGEWIDSFAVNAIAPWQMSVAFFPHLRKAQQPRVATLTSQMGSLERANSDRVAYRSSKAAANMAMRTLAIEWRETGIAVCALHPGWVRTDMGGDAASLGPVESAKGLLAVIDRLTLDDSGQFLDHQGAHLPW